MDQVVRELAAKLPGSATFQKFAEEHSISRDDWIQAIFPEGAPSRLALETTRMVSLASPGTRATLTTDLLASLSIGNHDTGAKVIFEAPRDIDREALAASLQKHMTANPTLEAVVWLVDRNALNAQHGQSGGTPADQPEGITFEVYRCGEFITTFERRSDPQDEILARARSLAPDKREILFGPESLGLGLEAYIKHLPPEHRASAVQQVLDAFEGASDAQFAGRRKMWERFESVGTAVSSAGTDVDVVGAVYGAVLAQSPLAQEHLQKASERRRNPELTASDPNLCDHLYEITDSTYNLLFTEGAIRNEMPFTEREAKLMCLAAPLHDLFKYLGGKEDQVMPDHEVMGGALIERFFEGRSYRFGD
ncbi:MAG: hypothetical protein EBZ48_17270, partial [Proteobacteria bacterium]|nr:hypothetical protein [Pseudomonadota bacterium]